MSSKPPRLTTCIEASRVEVAHAVSCELGEGALWHAELGVYLHVDIYGPSKLCAGPAVFLHDPYDAAAPPARCQPMPSFCGTVVPRASGGLLVALKDGVHALDLGSGALSFLLNPDGVATNRWNEGKCSPEGRFWAGTMGEPGKVKDNVGALYCIHADLTAARVVPDVTISNGLAWDVARKVMYFIDTPKGCVFAFDYDAASGAATNQRVAFRIPEGTGHPDGCCLDSDGNLWIAQWGGSRVCAYDPADGSVVAEASARAACARPWPARALHHTARRRRCRRRRPPPPCILQVQLPCENVSSCTFGGPGLKDLYITTAKEHLSAEQRAQQPLAGHCFLVRDIGWTGVPAGVFRG
jgi:hypothetical protein